MSLPDGGAANTVIADGIHLKRWGSGHQSPQHHSMRIGQADSVYEVCKTSYDGMEDSETQDLVTGVTQLFRTYA